MPPPPSGASAAGCRGCSASARRSASCAGTPGSTYEHQITVVNSPSLLSATPFWSRMMHRSLTPQRLAATPATSLPARSCAIPSAAAACMTHHAHKRAHQSAGANRSAVAHSWTFTAPPPPGTGQPAPLRCPAPLQSNGTRLLHQLSQHCRHKQRAAVNAQDARSRWSASSRRISESISGPMHIPKTVPFNLYA